MPINQTRTVTIPLLEQIPLASVSFPDATAAGTKIKYDGTNKTVQLPALNLNRIGAINWLAQTKITVGSGHSAGKTTFKPQGPVTRGAMVQFMHKLAYAVGSTTVVPD